MQGLESKIGYNFRNKLLFQQAMTHSSYSNEQKINKVKNYERIEFLGDAVLELVWNRSRKNTAAIHKYKI